MGSQSATDTSQNSSSQNDLPQTQQIEDCSDTAEVPIVKKKEKEPRKRMRQRQ